MSNHFEEGNKEDSRMSFVTVSSMVDFGEEKFDQSIDSKGIFSFCN